ncbi:aminotransferase class I/II-fold pyridoxal phosphate-dependent enzyme [Methanobrevibacter sp.]|uniref:aminotransferase class I/II-fold pyridoxal phosphate-dependent enzyme n=1 Tax=Methanobrevibacter sp. TaxID=66852 RepID=UPI0038698094
MDAIILAAGMGKRLKELTKSVTKCMIEVNGVTLVERMLTQLDSLNLDRIIIVTGYKEDILKEFISKFDIKTPIKFISNSIYDKTNNIYSLYLAREHLIENDTLILESDLIFDDGILEDLISDECSNLALVAKYESWMDGTVVTIDDDDYIVDFLNKEEFSFEEIANYYKTVNIYKFSKDFSKDYYVPFLEAYIKSLGENEYYEQVLKVITNLNENLIKVKKLNHEHWYEIDDVQDLNIAESIFSEPNLKLKKFESRYGGYWRYPQIIDFCYLVNPYYPPKTLVDEIKSNFDVLLRHYPSGLDINTLLASKYFNVHQDHIVVGNGASELIKSLMENTFGDKRLGVIIPTFEEYSNRKSEEDLVRFIPQNDNFEYDYDDLIEFFGDKDIDVLLLINPDNPSGNYICKENSLKLAKWCQDQGITLILDESFIDFATEENSTFFSEQILAQYPNLILMKSISKSFGVPGLRLGVLASSDSELMQTIKSDVSIWNINSFAEFYLQIFEKYQDDFDKGIKKYQEVRDKFTNDLNSIENVRAIPSQANYVMCEILGDIDSRKLAEILLNDYNLIIKDLSNKKGCAGKSYIRLAVRDETDNGILVEAMKDVLEDK